MNHCCYCPPRSDSVIRVDLVRRRISQCGRRGDSPPVGAGTSYESRVSNVNLTQQENSLIDETRPAALAHLDEEALKELQSRLRKARDKHFSLLRRKGAARVEAEGARGAAQPANERSGEKVEIFDEALERVSQRLDAVDGE